VSELLSCNCKLQSANCWVAASVELKRWLLQSLATVWSWKKTFCNSHPLHRNFTESSASFKADSSCYVIICSCEKQQSQHLSRLCCARELKTIDWLIDSSGLLQIVPITTLLLLKTCLFFVMYCRVLTGRTSTQFSCILPNFPLVSLTCKPNNNFHCLRFPCRTKCGFHAVLSCRSVWHQTHLRRKSSVPAAISWLRWIVRICKTWTF